ncbi:uncharacterized protein fsbp isoform 2-T2 [Menidia menidia]
MNGSMDRADDSKENLAICVQREALARISGRDWSDLNHSPTTNSTSHNAEQQDVTFPGGYISVPGASRLVSQQLQLSDGDPLDISRLEHQQRMEALEQQQQMKILEWENRMKVVAWEQELVRERRKAVRQKEKAFRMKKAYYKAKLKRLGEDVPPSSSSSGDEEEKTSDLTG